MTSEAMNPYDAKAWTELEKWRDKRLGGHQRNLIPEAARDQLVRVRKAARGSLHQLPGADGFQELFVKALDGVLGVINRVTEVSLRRQAIVLAYARRGFAVSELSDIGKLSLKDIDKVRPRLDLHYTIASTVEGAAAGLAVAGGEILAGGGGLLGAGAGAAPGAGTVVSVMAADAAAVIAASTRAVAHTAAYFGYDTEDPGERVFALSVLNFGLAERAGKAAAYVELNTVVQALARRATWKQLDKNGVTQIVKGVYSALGMRITQDKLGQAVPVVGIVIGAGLNAHMLSKVTTDAEHLYRERFLRERYGLEAPRDHLPVEDVDEAANSISIVKIVDQELHTQPAAE